MLLTVDFELIILIEHKSRFFNKSLVRVECFETDKIDRYHNAYNSIRFYLNLMVGTSSDSQHRYFIPHLGRVVSALRICHLYTKLKCGS